MQSVFVESEPLSVSRVRFDIIRRGIKKRTVYVDAEKEAYL